MFPLLLALTLAPGAKQVAPPVMQKPTVPGPTAPPSCPTWKHYFQPAGNCAGAGLYPFMMQPRVCPVDVCPCDPAGNSDPNRVQAWVKEFSSAANIPYPRFDLNGNTVEGEGLLIYEGMRLTVDPTTGMYDLTFTATVPRMPVTLRLQLLFVNPNNAAEVYTLTLPPIRLQPNRDAKPGDVSVWTFHSAHRGYSTLLIDCENKGVSIPKNGNTLPRINANWELKRAGTARFGTPIAIDDPNR